MYLEKLPIHISRVFYRAGIRTDEALVQLSYKELLRIRNVGHGIIATVNERVRIPMGLEPLERPAVGELHPNTRAGQKAYWERYNRGEAYNGLHGYKKVGKAEVS